MAMEGNEKMLTAALKVYAGWGKDDQEVTQAKNINDLVLARKKQIENEIEVDFKRIDDESK